MYDIYKYTRLNLKTLANDQSSILMLVIWMSLSFVIPIIFVDFHVSGGVLLLLYLIIPLFLILGKTTYTFRTSTSYQNLMITKMTKNKWYLSQIITILIVGFILTFVFWIFIFMFGYTGILLQYWGFENRDNLRFEKGFNIFEHPNVIVYILYDYVVTTLVVFAIYFLVHSFLSNEKSYYILVLLIFIIGIIFGGTFNNYFSATPNSNGDILMSGNLFPDNMFWISIVNPFFGVGQFATTAITEKISKNYSGSTYFIFRFQNEAYYWTTTLIQPYVWILFSLIIGSTMTITKKTN